MPNIKEYFIQEKEIGDDIFNTDVTSVYTTNNAVNSDRFKNHPDIETYIFNNDLNTNMYYKQNGVVLPIRYKPKLYLESDAESGIFIVKYYTIYKDSFKQISNLIHYNVLYNKDKTKEIIEQINTILSSNNKPLVNHIKLRFVTYIPNSDILLNNVVNVGDISILKDIDQSYINNENPINVKQTDSYSSLNVAIEFTTNKVLKKQMYFKISNDFIKIKPIIGPVSYDCLTIQSYVNNSLINLTSIPISKENRNIFGLYTKEEMEDEKTDEKQISLLEDVYDNAFKKREIINDIKKTIVNDDQAKLEVQKAIFKLTKEINDNEIKKAISNYKGMVKNNKADTNLVADVLKIFKSII